MVGEGFHEGELAVQRRAGAEAAAARLTGMLAAPNLSGGIGRFLADREFAVIASRDAGGRLWASPLFEAPGFLEPRPATLVIHATPHPGDPLAGLPAGQPIGLIAIEFAARRRARINGTLTRVTAGELEIKVDQAYGNCPQYIQQRRLDHARGTRPAPGRGRRADHLTAQDAALITRADTFFLGTVHPARGADASHRGGPPGFVRVAGDGAWWPDYPGNSMFNSFGNLAVDPAAALLFLDFGTGRTLHLSGTAEVEWTAAGIDGDDGGTGRRVRFASQRIATGFPLGVHSGTPRPSPDNPPLT
jgi:predicted pyridoxine 5'-phosphate oxidase superfamily flavin-nucleotide-binding protein